MLTLFACDKTAKEIDVPVSSVSLSGRKIEITLGKTIQLTAEVLPSNATDKTVHWSSSNPSVAIVSNSGLITAVAEGQSTITASAGGESASCQVTVSNVFVAVESIALNKTEIILSTWEAETLIATVSPSDATDKTITWSSSNTSIATVDGNGKVET